MPSEQDAERTKQITVNVPEREWQCIECGHVIEAADRPGSCPDCNHLVEDIVEQTGKPWLNLFIPREACGWWP